jgi:hypothetical protein
MSVRLIQGTAVDMTGTAISGATVTATLSSPICITATGVVVPAMVTTTTNGSGVYQFNLYANADLTPAGTTYSIVVHQYTQAAIAIVVTNAAYPGGHPTYFDIVADNLIVAMPAPVGVQTITGPIGATGPQGTPGGSFLAYKGVWNSGTAYILGDGVYDNTAGASFICIQAHTNHEPPNASYWGVIAPLRTGSGYGG